MRLHKKNLKSSPPLQVVVAVPQAYRLAGGKILCVNEFVKEAQTTYKENYPDTPILPDDIKELTGQDLLDAAGVKAGEVDILDGSPPCSAFSMAGAV